MSEDPFEIPQTVRDMAEQNMKQAQAAYDHLSGFVTEAMSSWIQSIPANPLTASFKDVQERAMDFAKDNAESTFSFAAQICKAQNPQEIMALQTQFAQTRMQAFASHTQELCGMIGDVFQKTQHS